MSDYHIPVLYTEVIENLITNKDGVYVDCTLGGGGHSKGILDNLDDKGRLICIDQDINAINAAKKRLKEFEGKFEIFKDNFENIESVLFMAGYDKVDGILMDIGVSSKQLDDPERGFSYRYDNKLDMRMNIEQKKSAYEVVNEYNEKELADIIYQYGEERHSRKIAAKICEVREKTKIKTTKELSDIIKSVVKSRSKHPAKKTFQAIRIEVNDELEILRKTIKIAMDLLKPKGRLAIITFHSLEDRIVKEEFKKEEKGCTCPPDFPTCVCGNEPKIKIINKKPITASREELLENRRAHSSKLRVVERL